MLTIIFSWAVLSVAIFLVGRLMLKQKVEWYEYFWIGFVAVIGILQIWSIFLPVNIFTVVFIFLIAGLSLILILKRGPKFPKPLELLKFVRRNPKFVIFGSLSFLCISYFASLPVGWEDTLLYHLNAVKWSNLYPVVPGLANLHSRFGLNSSFFLFASMIDNWLLNDKSSHVALSLLASVLSLEFLWIFLKSKNRMMKIFILFMLPLFASLIMQRTLVASLSPDFALIIIVLAICLEVLNGEAKSFLVAALLSLLLLTIKFSGVSFAAVILLYITYKFFKRRQIRSLLTLVFVGIFLITPFVIRNIYLSGWMFYPLPLFGLDAPWAVRASDVSGMYNVIQAWARLPGEGWYTFIGLPFWQWFPDWYKRNTWHIEMKMFFLGVFLILVIPLTNMLSKADIKKWITFGILCIASFVSAFYMLFTAPDFRFGEIYFWVIFGAVASFYAAVILEKMPEFKPVFIFLMAYFIFTITWPIRIESIPIWKSVRWEPTFPVEKVLAVPRDGSPSFEILKPTDSDLCGNSDLPCTPYNNSEFKEISPGDRSKGYAPVN